VCENYIGVEIKLKLTITMLTSIINILCLQK